MKRNKPLNRGNSQLKRSGFKKKATKPLKRTPLRKVGKIGKANLEANKRIKELELPEYCEVQLSECKMGMFLTNAHRHKRAWYKGDVELLSDKKQVIRACVSCHEKIEFDAELTEKIFMNLRGEE